MYDILKDIVLNHGFKICRNLNRSVLAMHSKYFWCDIVHSINMGRWYCRSCLWIFNCFDLLLCGKNPIKIMYKKKDS